MEVEGQRSGTVALDREREGVLFGLDALELHIPFGLDVLELHGVGRYPDEGSAGTCLGSSQPERRPHSPTRD